MAVFERLKELVETNSHTHNKVGVDRVGEYCGRWLEALGLQKTVYAREQIGDHLLFASGRQPGERILLLGHLDTVYPPGAFDNYRSDDQWVYGPGVCDMKGGIVVAIAALERVRRQYGPLHNVDLLLVSDEETGSDDSHRLTAELVRNYDYCLVLEAAGRQLELVTARKGVGTFSIDIQGGAAHSGLHFQDGIDANLEAAHKVIALSRLTDFAAGTTLNVGRIGGGVGANTISAQANLLFEIRFESSAERQRLQAAIDAIVNTSHIAGTHSSLSGRIQREVMEETTAQRQLLESLRRISGQQLPIEHRAGVSDANIAAACGVATIDGLGPFGDGDHTNQERALKESLYSRIDLLAQVILWQQQQRTL